MLAMGLALIAVITPASPAAAVTGGRPDNGAHPQVALILPTWPTAPCSARGR